MKRAPGPMHGAKTEGHRRNIGEGVAKRHELQLRARESLKVDGVLHVDSFDDEEVVVETDLGTMTVKGDHLHIKELNLTSGLLLLTGYVKSIEYSDGGTGATKRKNFFRRVFK